MMLQTLGASQVARVGWGGTLEPRPLYSTLEERSMARKRSLFVITLLFCVLWAGLHIQVQDQPDRAGPSRKGSTASRNGLLISKLT